MAKKRKKRTATVIKSALGKAKNCNETCSSYDYCEKEGNTKRFIPSATCTDFHPKEKSPIPAIAKIADHGDGNVVDLISTVRIENRRKRRNTFLADAVRDENDRTFLNEEIGDSRSSGLKRKYKGKIKTITTIKHYDLIDGDWLTEYIIDLKE